MARRALALACGIAGVLLTLFGIQTALADSEDATLFLEIWYAALFLVPGVLLVVAAVFLWRR